MTVKTYTPEMLEIVNEVVSLPGDKAPTIVTELGVWEHETGEQTGILIDIFGDRAPILGPVEARRLAKWLMQAAETLDGQPKAAQRKGQKKRRYDEDDDE